MTAPDAVPEAGGDWGEAAPRARGGGSDLDRLRALLEADVVKLGVDIRRANSPGSPVFRAWENVWPPGLVVVASYGATILLHTYLGFAILGLGGWWWLARIHPRIKDGVFDRTASLVLTHERNLDGLWSRGWLSLYAKLEDGREFAATRRDSWREFVSRVEAARAGEG